MKALVFGATGFVGSEVVRQLCLRGDSVVAHIRPDSVQIAAWRARWEPQGAVIDTSPWQLEALVAAMRMHVPDAVFILIGTTAKRANRSDLPDGHGDQYQKVDYGFTKLVCDAVSASALPSRLVYLSSLGADASAGNAYLKARGQAEDAVRQCGNPWVMARPAIITGSGDSARPESRPAERAMAVAGDCALTALKLFGARKLASRYRSTTAPVLASALIRIAQVVPSNQIFDGEALR
jgi:uncharacterized protein YbjT (DUF2867 family)